MAEGYALPFVSSSFILSKIITLVSTAKPMVSTKPAIPAAVKVNPNIASTPIVNSKLNINAIFATHPPVL